jgi:hypothetical protein
MIEAALRWSAIAIAVAATIDPAVSLSGRVRPRAAILSEADARADRVRDRLATDLRSDFDIVYGTDATVSSAVIVGDRYPDVPLPSGAAVSTVTLAAASPPNVSIAAVRAPRQTPPNTAIPVEADVEAVGAAGSASTLVVSIAGVEVGRASHAWHGDQERWRAALNVTPVGNPPFVLHAQVGELPTERNRDDNAADALVASSSHPLRVLAFEPRPSWAATFVRRAIEADGRFAIRSVTQISRGIAVRTGAVASLADPAALDEVDAVIVGGLERVSAEDVRALERFMRERGGSVALLPDGRVDADPVRALVPEPLPSEALVDAHAPLAVAASVPRIDASETLVFRRAPADADVLARAAGSSDPVILVVPHGDGRLLFSGALDAWRSRAERGVEFDRFWQSAIAALALETPPAIDVQVTPPLLRAGDSARVAVHVRGAAPSVSATLDTGEAIRLWPTATPGGFTGSFTSPDGRGAHTIEVVANGTTQTKGRGIFVTGDAVRLATPSAPLALLAASHGGINVTDDDLPALERHLRSVVVSERAVVRYRPLRSPWWLVPFAACLSGEWWLRRRRGQR